VADIVRSEYVFNVLVVGADRIVMVDRCRGARSGERGSLRATSAFAGLPLGCAAAVA